MNVLRETFPDVQFIITTHSPQILGETDDDCGLYYMIRDGMPVNMNILKPFQHGQHGCADRRKAVVFVLGMTAYFFLVFNVFLITEHRK